MQKRCSGIQKCLTKIANFVCRKGFGFTGRTKVDEKVTLNGTVIEEVAKFSYVADVLLFSTLEVECKNLPQHEQDLNGRSLRKLEVYCIKK